MPALAPDACAAGPSTPRRPEHQAHLAASPDFAFPRLSLSPGSLAPSPFASTFSTPSALSSNDASVDYFGTPTASSSGGRRGDLSHSTAASSLHAPSPTAAKPIERSIESVSIPHFSKSGKQWLFACRVVPTGPSATREQPAYSRRQSLGKMSLAGDGEPHTVWRSWQDFCDFAAGLLAAFPDERPNVASPMTCAPAVPRLVTKMTLFTTRSTLVRRQEELELFCRQLFALPEEITNSPRVRSFFQLGLSDQIGALSLRETVLTRPALPNFASMDDTHALQPPRSLRPTLAIKTSSPDLRTAISEFDDGPRSGAPSPLAWAAAGAPRTAMLFQREQGIRSDSSSSRTAVPSTCSTITPPSLSARSSPLPPADAPLRPADTVTSSGSFAKTLRKKASGSLKHFRSLGDLRGASKKSLPPTPTEPVPALPAAFAFPSASAQPAAAMERASTQPILSKNATLPPTPLDSARRPAPLSATSPAMGRFPSAPTSAPLPLRHRRTGSTKSSASSIEDLWGSPFPQFRQTPSGRVECVRPEELARSADSRRQSATFMSAQFPQRVPSSGSQTRTRPPMPRPGQHVSSASISSIDSVRSSISSASGRSLVVSLSRSSGGSECFTPPTPQMEWTPSLGAAGDEIRQKATAGKYSVENGVLYENNMVPPPPFFPVPPQMGSAEFAPRTPRSSGASLTQLGHSRSTSSDKVPSTPRSRAASGASISSRRRISSTGPFALETIQCSPAQSSAASTPRTIDGASSYWTFKFLHREENIVLRVPKPDNLTGDVDSVASPVLQDLRAEVRSKFRACGVDLPEDGGEAEWGLAWTPRGQPGAIRLVVAQADLDECLADFYDAVAHGTGRGKLVMKIIC
ncbi:hypothetical protein JCM10908_005641 [Rhodotorula pacifica]|uniref:uncharacterized protein n=1 Tax=Rhodotorula pacifica TaxID=1495444 RepID=UPI00316F6C1D